MNKQEAYEFLVKYIDNYDPDNDYTEFCNAMKCIHMLAPPTPDPETGLVRCGCGGKPYMLTSHVNNKPYYIAHCNSCPIHIGTYSTYQKAVDAWNQAMS